MSKRFPIPAFDRDPYKNMKWESPRLLSEGERASLVERAGRGDAGAFGSYPVGADEAFFDRFAVRGPHRHAVMCVLPRGEVRLVGRSWAWFLQRAVLVDSLEPGARVLHDWKTPRPMNTRLGPDEGVTLEGGVVYAVIGHRYGDHWVANRTLADNRGVPAGKGFAVVSATDDDNHDFHACNLSFSWS
jgi:hypothetical protein